MCLKQRFTPSPRNTDQNELTSSRVAFLSSHMLDSSQQLGEQMQTAATQNTQSSNVAQLARLVNCLDENDFATLAGVKKSTLDSWRKRGKGPEYVLLGCNYLYPIPSVQNHLASLLRTRTLIDPKTVLIN
jgi:hypothetical protein